MSNISEAFKTIQSKSIGLEETFLTIGTDRILSAEDSEYAKDACNQIISAVKEINGTSEVELGFTIDELDRFDAIYAFDTGCTDSGIKDDAFKASVSEDVEKAEAMITALAKQRLSSDGYGIEDVASIINWASDELNIDF